MGPNDLTFGPDSRLYFTDPGAFDLDDPDEGQICVVEPNGSASVLERVGPSYPNGIVAEQDGSIVWNESYTRRVKRRRPGGEIELLATLPENRVADGMKVAADGRIFIAGVSSGGFDVIAPDGEVVGFVETGGEPLNSVFDGTDLLVTDFGEGSVPATTTRRRRPAACCGCRSASAGSRSGVARSPRRRVRPGYSSMLARASSPPSITRCDPVT